jgi:hypothetical protein
VRSFAQLSADELLAAGAACENRLNEIEAELQTLVPTVEAEGRKLKSVAGKLGLSSSAAVVGVVAATATGGLSLWAALLPVLHAGWEIRDFAVELKRLLPIQTRLKELRQESKAIADDIEAIHTELESRL